VSAGVMSLQLLGCFQLLVDDQIAHLPFQAQRVVAYLAVSASPIARRQLAETLWPFSKRSRAHANLRTALWRVGHEAPQAVTATHDLVQLDGSVEVDYRALLTSAVNDPAPAGTDSTPIDQLTGELLPGWDEEWLMIERERSRQICLRQLETLSRHHLGSGAVAEAIDAALASIGIEPLRESSHLALIEAHVADGNHAEAARQVTRLTDLLHSELSIAPSPQFRRRVASLGLPLAS